MITHIEKLPLNMVGFRASGKITEVDFSEIVMPKVKELIKKTDKLNYMLVLDTSIKNFTAGAWFKDTIMGIKHLTKWNRAAIVSDIGAIRTFTEIFSHFYSSINPGNNWNILQVPTNVADDTPGIKAGKSLNELLLADIPAENKIAMLIYAYGFKKAEAEAMCGVGE